VQPLDEHGIVSDDALSCAIDVALHRVLEHV
jgi:hypothetical protein